MMLKGVIFDLDGVLVDTVPAHYAAWHRLFVEEGYHFDEQVYHDKVDGRRRQDGVRAVMTDAEPRRVEAAGKRKDKYFLELIDQGRFSVFEGSLAFLKLCQERQLRLATASSSRNVRHVLQKAGIVGFFDAVVGGDDVDRGKPDPSIFLLAAARLGLEPSSCIVVEDAVSGVVAAKAGGFYCVGVDRNGPASRLSAADMLVGDLGELNVERLAASMA